jgi:cytoskeletal protein CcmA (bactofilin family)
MKVTTQAELDNALSVDGYSEIDICSPYGVWLTIIDNNGKYVEAHNSAMVRAYDSATVTASGSATVRAYDSATVTASGSATVTASGSAMVTASGSAMVRAYDSATVRASGSAMVRASGSAMVRAYGSATVRAHGSATVRAYDSATVTASGSATVTAYDSATVTASGSATVTASQYVAVHLHSKRVTINGGVVIDITNLDRTQIETWADYHGAEIIDGEVIVHKAVNDDMKSHRGFAYPIGETVECPDWDAGDFCGNGLHLSPRPHHALAYLEEATRFLRCAVPLDELTIIDGNSSGTPKLKARVVRVIAEVDIDGNLITTESE